MRGVYAIVDLDLVKARRLDPEAFAGALLAARPAALQLRAKSCDGGELLRLATSLSRLARDAGTPFFVNDRADIALLVEGAGLHVGQDDLPPEAVAELARGQGRTLAVGLSTHDEAQVERATQRALDYLAIGPFFATASKANPDPVLGPARGRALAERFRRARPGVPIVAIGGIDHAAARELAGSVDMIAVIGAITPAEGEPVARAGERLHALARAFGDEGASA